MLRVCTLMNRVEDHYPELEQSCMDRDIPLFTYIRTGPWSWRGKVEWELELAEQHPEDHFVFIDSFDYLCTGDRGELEEIAKAQPLLFPVDRDGGEKATPWPLPHLRSAFDKRRKAETPWSFLNGSGPCGQGKHIAKAIKFGFSNYEFFEPGTDQLFCGELDQQCKLTQPLYWIKEGELGYKDGRALNLVTGSKPQFIHATGRTWAWINNELIPKKREPRA
jgi:hypothetical protein